MGRTPTLPRLKSLQASLGIMSAPLKPPRVSHPYRIGGLRGAPLCRETLVSRTVNVSFSSQGGGVGGPERLFTIQGPRHLYCAFVTPRVFP